MQMVIKNLYTVADVADQLGLTPGRIRQICREHNIGQVFGRDRLMDENDVKRIKNLPDRRKKVAG